jgi:hypothetical protein
MKLKKLSPTLNNRGNANGPFQISISLSQLGSHEQELKAPNIPRIEG